MSARDVIACFLDHPSVFMGGPSERNQRKADAILAALSAAGWVVEQGWQPIETAPKDDWMYVWHAKHKWLRIGRKFGGAGPRWYFSGHVPGGAQYGDGDEAPTHWRPLPAAPQEGQR